MVGAIEHADSINYYTAAIEVIPVFLLALAVERDTYSRLLSRILDRQRSRQLRDLVDRVVTADPLPPLPKMPQTHLARLVLLALMVLLVFLPLITLVGFLACVWVLANGTDSTLLFVLCTGGMISGAILVSVPLFVLGGRTAWAFFSGVYGADES